MKISRLLLAGAAFASAVAATVLDSAIAQSNPLIGKLYYQRNRTLNQYGGYYLNQCDLARRCEWDQMTSASKALERETSKLHLRNRGGWRFISMVVPTIAKISQNTHNASEAQRHLVSAIQLRLEERI